MSYCEWFLELVTDLEAQLPSHRFFNTLFNDRQAATSQGAPLLTPPSTCQVRCYLSQLVKREPEGYLFKKVSSTVPGLSSL